MVVAAATEARGVATVAVAMRADAVVAAVADGADVIRAMRQRAPPPSVARPATAARCSRDRAAVQVEAQTGTLTRYVTLVCYS